jgi:hypothetical protein
MREKAALCLATGASEFWTVDPDSRTVIVMRPGQPEISYEIGSSFPLTLFGGSELSVADIFESIA